jgi:RNA polymerase sigma factor (sigma-70 family)
MNSFDTAQHTDLDLIARATAGDAKSRAGLAARLDPAIRGRVERVLRRLTPGWAEDTDDVAQAVWVVLLKNDARQLRAFAPERGISLEAYVAMIAEREVRNHIAHATAAKRGAGRRAPLTDEIAALAVAPTPSPEEQAVATDLAESLVEALVLHFPERARNVMTLCFERDEGADAAARALQLPSQQVYNWVFRLRKASRVFLETAAA